MQPQAPPSRQAVLSYEIMVPQAPPSRDIMEPQAASRQIMQPQAAPSWDIMEPQAEASDEITEPRAEASETFGDTDSHAKISASHLRLGVVSIALYNGDYAAMHKLKYCSPKSYSLPVNDLNHVLVQKK
jgi:hypothetical protein